jgi:hypothetical protein
MQVRIGISTQSHGNFGLGNCGQAARFGLASDNGLGHM